MELIDTPNPNAKKINLDFNDLNGENLKSKKNNISELLENTTGVKSIFFGPDFITISKDESIEWELIIEDIASIFDKL
tara:strand:+ start:244 stop:477 length:234 start_codon:yes stop_codon:yes gene_type:complete